MRVERKEFNRLNQVESLIKDKFPDFGLNKNQEIIRLLYEISKRENVPAQKVIYGLKLGEFGRVKEYLSRRRFPYAYFHNEISHSQVYLPRIELNPEDIFDPSKDRFYPKRIFIEKSVRSLYITDRFKKFFPESSFLEISSLSLNNYLKFKAAGYNNRRDTLFITKERYDFFKKCPCTKQAVRCGYHIFNLGFGCLFDCTYCYLQEYVHTPGIILPANLNGFFDAFSSYKTTGLPAYQTDRPTGGMRLGTGEFSDSLMLDKITEYSIPIIDFFKKHKDASFEFKTKSRNIANLLKTKHCGNIVVSWSLNPQKIINENEFWTASLSDRLDSAQKCVKAGYKVGFHFDPVFYFNGWQSQYHRVVEDLFSKIKPEHIALISIGTFRFKPQLKKIIEQRFPQNKILDEELLLGYDRKLRYPRTLRYEIYNFLLQTLAKHHKGLPIYLCMEEKSMWRGLNLAFPF